MTDLSGRLASSDTLYGAFLGLGLGAALAAEARARTSQNARTL